jgi:hypothetical protein
MVIFRFRDLNKYSSVNPTGSLTEDQIQIKENYA